MTTRKPLPAAPSLDDLRAHYGPRHRWLMLLAVMVGTMASIMSSTIVNVAIPDMSQHFGMGQEKAQWVSSGFMVAMTVSMLTTPWLLARFGYRHTYAGTMLLLLAGGLAGGLAPHFPLVLAARVAEGLAAGVVQPIPAIIIMRAFASHEQGRASGIFGMGVVLAPALGPSIGGLLVEWFGWRSIFFMVVPLCLASLWLAQRYVPVHAHSGHDEPRSTLDWAGLLLVTALTLCLLNGLLAVHEGQALQAAVLLGLAVLALLGFLAWQQRLTHRQQTPLLRLDLFQHRPFAMGSLVAFIYGMALFGSTYLLPVYMKLALQLPTAHVGTIMLPAGLMLALTIAVAGRLSDRYSTHKLVSLGLLLLAASFALMPTLDLHSTLWLLVAWSILGRMGLGCILPSLNSGSMRGLAPGQIAQAASSINFLRMLGGATGVNVCAIVLEWRVVAHGDSLSRPASSVARLAAFNETFVLLALVCALALLAAWQIRPPARAHRS